MVFARLLLTTMVMAYSEHTSDGSSYDLSSYDAWRKLTPSVGPMDDNETDAMANETDSMANETEADVVIVTPVVTTTFTSVLTFDDDEDIEEFMAPASLAAMADNLMAEGSTYEGKTVEITALIKIGIAYTFPEGTEISSIQCVTAVAEAWAVTADMVTCATAEADMEASAATTTMAAVTTTTTMAGRRLTDVVMDVQVAYTSVADAMAGEEANDDEGDFIAALADLESPITATPTASDTDVTVEVVIAVTGSDQADDPPVDAIAEASGFVVTATVSEAMVTYTIMPCSDSDGICGSADVLMADASAIGCAGEICTAALDAETCCMTAVVGSTDSGAPATCMLGSLVALVLSCNFLLS